jgi:hypothetical protein
MITNAPALSSITNEPCSTPARKAKAHSHVFTLFSLYESAQPGLPAEQDNPARNGKTIYVAEAAF